MLGADIGKSLLAGLAVGFPMAVAGGLFYSRWIGSRIYIDPPEHLMPKSDPRHTAIRQPPLSSVVSIILLPVVMMATGILVSLFFSSASKIVFWARFIGHPTVALISTALLSCLLLGVRLGMPAYTILSHTNQALNSVGSLILIIGASGAFRQIVVDSGAGNALVKLVLTTSFSPVLMTMI